VAAAELVSRFAAELALFAGVGFLLFAINDLLVDIIYFARAIWRSLVIYTRYPRAFASALPQDGEPGFIALLVPAWDESAVIASMLRATIERVDYADYRIFAGYYRNDPATAAAIASIADTRVEAVQIDRDGPTTKADCLNHLYDALVAYENDSGRGAKAVVLHDAEDVVHPLELRIFDRLIDRAAVIQLPVLPLPDPHSRWISGHYCDEFAEAHVKELVVREAVGAAIPLAGVGCAIARRPLSQLAAMQDGRPFAGNSMTEDYEIGLRLGALGLKTMFVRLPVRGGTRRCRQPRPFSGDARRGRSAKGALARGNRAVGLGPAGLERRPGRTLDADARPPRAACRAPPDCGLQRGAAVVADLACRSARCADRGAARSRPRHSPDDQRLAAGLANPHAGWLHRLRLWPR
jgi:adsorption protein B